ncbi:trypsin-like serine protease [Xenorhabdus sp. XENO-10]|uniref:Trypsin-like serine protease n=1 Tax=Xenorhabdus yunnanensis TaxID=3025878 RepID=A0ABT5LG63_9GAMM|nr:trypsin-like serine protease [Xenorhabdus yunnanensis]MDC9590097.1 trypsin-like serine protease [Xenorhabdus yunnanensis]
MIAFRTAFILFFLFYFSQSFSDSESKSPPLEAIVGGVVSCNDTGDDKCKPWVISIYYEDENSQKNFLCSGSLIAPNYVLTAGHCEEKGAKKYYVMDFKKREISTALTSNFIIYKNNDEGHYHDFALIKLEKEVELEEFGRVRRFFNYDAAYEALDEDYYQSSSYGYGFLGIDKTTGQQIRSDGVQHRADVKIVNPAYDYFRGHGLIIKANEKEGLKPGIIQSGDSGGPIIWKDTIIGVTSFGFEAFKVEKTTDDENYYPFFGVSDITGKHDDIGFNKKFFPGQWFAKYMNQIWIDTPDWQENLTKRSDNILVKGWGKPFSKIQLSYSINEGQEKLVSCKEKVNPQGEWQCKIPRNDLFTENINEEKDHKVAITVKEVNARDKPWREDTVQAKIPAISKEFGIIYPADKTTVFTKNFMIRGYADPGSNVTLVLKTNKSESNYTQLDACKNLNNENKIKTTDYGFWSCTIKDEFIDEIEYGNDEVEYEIIASQKTDNINLHDQINIVFKPNKNTKVKAKKDINSTYRKMLNFNVSYDQSAKLICLFRQNFLDCRNANDNKDKFRLLNSRGDDPYSSPSSLPMGIMQKIENIDPFDSILWSKDIFLDFYLSPTFYENNRYEETNPKEIEFSSLKDQKFSGYGGDNEGYTLPNGDKFLPSEYSICMKKNDDLPLFPGQTQCYRKEDKDIYLKIPLENGKDFSEISIEYGTYFGKPNFPNWNISPPSSLNDGLYYIELADKYHPLGLKHIKEDLRELPFNKSYFHIKKPSVEIKSISEGETETVGDPSFLSGSSNEPGDEVDVKRRKIDSSSTELVDNNQNIAQETIICSGAVVSDNGNWDCKKPITFPAGTYELTAELIKEGKIVATDVTHITVKDKNDDDEPEKKKFEVKNPKNNSTVDPDNPITFSGTLSGSGGGGGGFGGFLSSIFGAIFGAVEGIASLFSGAFGFFWEFVIHPEDILGGDTYTMELQETQNGVNVGDPIKWTFTIPMRITEPKPDEQYRLHDEISIKGQGSPGQLVFVTGSEYLLPPEKMTLPISSEGIICTATVDKGGKWLCPNNPVLKTTSEGKFFFYAAQYKKTSSAQLGQLGDTYERTSQVTRKYEVTKTKIQIITPAYGAKITTLPFTISGTGEKGAQVYIEGFGSAKDCNTTVDSSGKWSCGSYQPEEGKYSISVDQFIDNALDSKAVISFEIQTKTVTPVTITQPHNGGVYRHLEDILPKGTGEPGTMVCLAQKVLPQVCQDGAIVNEQGHWEWVYGLDTAVKGEQKLVATAFLDKVRQSTAKVTFKIEPNPGETTLTVETPKEDEVIKTPSYTFSGTMPSNAKTVTVKAFGDYDDCVAKLNEEDYTWSCGPYSSVPGDYDVAVVDDAGSQINRSFKVRYGDNLQMRVLEPAEEEQIATPTYSIKGKGQAGARITVSIAGKQICEVDVNENQDWICPEEIKSIPNAYRLLAQQWVDDAPSGKPITRDYEVIYGVRDIAVLKPTEGESITTKEYEITGKGQIGAHITVSSSGNKICDVLVNENQDWNCPNVQSVPGIHELLAQQWVNDKPMNKSVKRHYKVMYGIQDIKIDSTASAFCPNQDLNEPTSVFVTGTATKGAYISLTAQSGNTCGTTQASTKDGSWICRIDDVGLGQYHLTATQSFTPNDYLIGTIVNQELNVIHTDFRVIEPWNGLAYEPFSWNQFSAWVNMSGTGTPNSEVSLEVVESSSGHKNTAKVKVDNQGNWSHGGFRAGGFLLNVGNYTLHASTQSCGKNPSASVSFSVVPNADPPCPPHRICD